MRKVLMLVPVLLMAISLLRGQTAEQGAVLGVVTDQSGAVIPGAKVTVTNLDTGFTKEESTNSSGEFEILALPIGPYTADVSMRGFKSWKMDRLVLEIGQRSKLLSRADVGERGPAGGGGGTGSADPDGERVD